jgi:hypothetical protein
MIKYILILLLLVSCNPKVIIDDDSILSKPIDEDTQQEIETEAKIVDDGLDEDGLIIPKNIELPKGVMSEPMYNRDNSWDQFYPVYFSTDGNFLDIQTLNNSCQGIYDFPSEIKRCKIYFDASIITCYSFPVKEYNQNGKKIKEWHLYTFDLNECDIENPVIQLSHYEKIEL